MVGEILVGKTRRLAVNPLWSFAVGSSHFWEEWGARLFGRLLRTLDDCMLCERCVSACPTGNIHREGERIVFGWNCLWCMRCIYACPKQALQPRLFRFSAIKDGYNLDEIAARALGPNEEGVGPEIGAYKGYYAHFRDYVERVEV